MGSAGAHGVPRGSGKDALTGYFSFVLVYYWTGQGE